MNQCRRISLAGATGSTAQATTGRVTPGAATGRRAGKGQVTAVRQVVRNRLWAHSDLNMDVISLDKMCAADHLGNVTAYNVMAG